MQLNNLHPSIDYDVTGWAIYPSSPVTFWDKIYQPDDNKYIFLLGDVVPHTAIFGLSYLAGPRDAMVAVELTVKAKFTSDTTNNLGLVLRCNGFTTEYTITDVPAGSEYVTYSHRWDYNPITGDSWMLNDVMNLDFGIKGYAGSYTMYVDWASVSVYSTDFFVDVNGKLLPLDLTVIRDSKVDLLPTTRDYTDTIPGRHGEVYFGTELESRIIELHAVSPYEIIKSELPRIKRDIAKYLNPMYGPKELIFADEIEKAYWVVHSGKVDITQYTNWLDLTIPFKCYSPFIIGSLEKTLTQDGDITNGGNYKAPLIIEVEGPTTAAISITIGADTIGYSNLLAEGETLYINTENMTVIQDDLNGLGYYTGNFPWVNPGDTYVIINAEGTTTFKWRDRWI